MPATPTDRINNTTTSVAIKAPCQAVTNAAITLAGLQTIGTVTVVEGDRVLVKDQANLVENGIYVASATDWSRAVDFDGARDAVNGTQVLTVPTSASPGTWYRLIADNPVVIGSSELQFTLNVFPTPTTSSFPSVFDYMTSAQIADVLAGTFSLDVAAALRSAFADGVGYMPGGGYRCNTAVTVAAADGLQIIGEGASKVEMRFAVGVNGLSLTYSNVASPPSVRGVTITTLNLGPGVANTGMSITMTPTAPTTYRQGPIIHDVVVRGVTPTTMGWSKNVFLSGLWYPTIDGLTCKGYSAAGAGQNSYETLFGIHINACTAPFITNLYLQHVNDGIYEDSTALACEGFQITQFEMVGVRTGFTFGAGLGPASPQPGNYIGEGHVNCSYRGIDYRQRVQTEIASVSFYRTPDTTEAWIGIQLADSDQNVISGCFFGNTSANVTTCYGVFLAGTSSGNIVSNLTADAFNTTGSFVQLANTASDNVIMGDTFQYGTTGTVWTEVTLSTLTGTGNRFADARAAITLLTANSATPSVDNAVSGAFQTQNSAPTTITNFSGGFPGQVIKVLVNDAFTTFQNNGSTISMQGALNHIATSGDVLVFRNFGGSPNLWRHIGGTEFVIQSSGGAFAGDGSLGDSTGDLWTVTARMAHSGRHEWKQGTDVVAANDLTLGADGNVFEVTGNTTINRIALANWQAGSVVILQLKGTPTVTNGSASGGGFQQINLLGGLNFLASADDHIILRLGDDSIWWQIAGSLEQKTFTPTLLAGGAPATGSYVIQAGRYVKNHAGYISGNATVSISSRTTSTGTVTLGGLPYTVRNNSDAYAPAAMGLLANFTYTGQMWGYPELNTTTVTLVYTTEAGIGVNLSSTNLTTTAQMSIAFNYRAST